MKWGGVFIKSKKGLENKKRTDKDLSLGFLKFLRFHTTFHLHMKAHRIGWYKEWHQWRLAHHFHVAMLVFYIASILLGSLAAFFPSENALAATQDWTFDEAPPGNYYNYNSSKVAVSGSQAALGSHTPSTDWIADDGGDHFYYRKAITVTNNSGGALTDYQVFLNDIDTSFGSKIQDQCQDLRFTSSDGFTENEYWVESGCKTATTDIWVKAPSLAAGENTIYMYYGNSSASAKYASDDASADAVFVDSITGVQGAWKFDETNVSPYSYDSSGNDYDGAPSGALIADAAGKFGYAAKFQNSAPGWSKSTVNGTTAQNLKIANNYSFSGWIYPTTTNTFRNIINKDASQNYTLAITDTNKLALFWYNGGWKWSESTATITPNTWTHIAVTYSNPNLKYYFNGVESGSSGTMSTPMLTSNGDMIMGVNFGSTNPFVGYMDEFAIINRNPVLTQAEITALAGTAHYSYFSSSHPNTAYLREYTATAPTAGAPGSEEGYYYNDYPTIQNQGGGNGFPVDFVSAIDFTTGGTGSVRFQVSPDNGTTWYWYTGGVWTETSAGYTEANTESQIETGQPIQNFHPSLFGQSYSYFRWRAYFVSDGTQQPTLTNVSITYQVDTTAPDNPVIGGVTCYESDGGAVWVYNPAQLWHNYSAPKFDWTPPSDTGNPDASGVWRYYAKRDTDVGYTPTSADATTSPSLIASSLTNGQTYYLRMRTEDNAENVSSASTLLTYKYDNDAPTDPANLQANTLQPTDQPLSFNWSASTDPVPGGGEASGLDHYEYKAGAISGWQSTTETSVSGITGDEDGNNTFRVRAVDTAGNISGEDTIVYQYILNAPSEPLNLSVTDQSKTVNNFEFSWDPPSYVKPGNTIAGYKFFVNELPSASPSNDYSYIGAGENDLGNVVTKSGIRATQQGVNRFYVVAYDSEGKVNYSNYAWKDFNIDTTATAPTAPQTVVISDVSDRHKPDHYALALSWKAPSNYDASTFGHYSIRRTTTAGLNDSEWLALTPVGTTTSPAYAEANLTKDQMYYYRISGVDNAGAEVALSQVVNKAPTGKYIEPPTDSLPSVAVTATTATITWTTDRISYSKVEYGKTGSYGMQNSSLQTTNNHSVTLYGLDPGTAYHYRTQSLDPSDQEDYDDNLAYSADYTFQTQPAPGISDVKISDIRLDSAIVTWKTTSSATSTLRYGKTNAYGKELSDSSGSAVTTHTVKLTGLDHSSTYHFKIFGADTDGNTMQSDDYNFDTLTFPKVSSVGIEQLKHTATATMKVNWESNVPISSVVYYTDPTGKSMEAAQSELKTSHELVISGLKDNTDYTLVVKGRDAYGNEANSGSEKFKTDFDTRPPKVSEITTETSISGYGSSAKAQIVVSWYTDEPSTSQVEYSKGVSGDTYLLSTQEDGMLTTSHVVVVSDLDPSSSYFFRVVSKDNSGNEGKSDSNSVLTEEARSSIFDLVIKSFESTLGWLFGG
ncbi:DUF2341 domain-containing protein [candidate division WS5 bacterium]|uniref:DUF2341 domain-containing protein n=1 Tax=candidate division WS5 bacterium TaxID=2093353 RepID=A0A419DFQ8_9BACT|nr:MAG: DUF2341 domain-containing protein [candidate division WS5 bacterium]